MTLHRSGEPFEPGSSSKIRIDILSRNGRWWNSLKGDLFLPLATILNSAGHLERLAGLARFCDSELPG